MYRGVVSPGGVMYRGVVSPGELCTVGWPVPAYTSIS